MKKMPEASNSLLNVLSLEDDLKDAELLHEMLVDADYQVSMDIAKGEKEYVDFLKGRNYDIIFADNSVTSFDALAALRVALSLKPEIPFICVSGTIGEEKAVELIKQGATDYVIKDRLNRLAFAVQSALKEKETQKERKHAEKTMQDIIDNNPMSIQILDAEGLTLKVNQSFMLLFGSIPPSDYSMFNDVQINEKGFGKLIDHIKKGEVVHFSDMPFNPHDSVPEMPDVPIWVRTKVFPLVDDKGKPEKYVFMHENITEQKQIMSQLQASRDYLDNIINAVGSPVFVKDDKHKFCLVNTAFCSLLNLSAEELIGKTGYENSPKEQFDVFIAKDKEVFETCKENVSEELMTNGRGEIRNIISRKTLYTDAQGNKFLVGIINDITYIKQAELDLIKAKEKAEESDRLKSAFLTNMSHEIRTPMNGILGFAELLKRPNLTDEQQQEFISIIGESGNRMLNTINNIMDVSKIEAGLLSVYISESNINMQIEFLYTFFTPLAESKGLQLSFNNGLPSKEAIIKTDSGKISSILTNLVNNAIKFTDEGSIEFGYEKKGEYLEFYVKDTGIGIPKDRLDAIFERFIRADIEDKRAFQGSGLGLTISKSYVEMLGGKIWVKSEEGLGSLFYFTIPYNAISEEKNVIGNAVSEKDEEVQIKNLKILIAEDEETSAFLITEALQEISHKIIHAETGVEAIEACRNNPDIGLILMDIRMPEMDGYEATRQIRLFNTDVIIIAQTAYAFAVDREKAIEAGCNDYISKPIDMTLLNELIKKHCNG